MKPFFLTILSLLLLAACSQPTPAPGTQIALTVQRPADTPTPAHTPTRTASPPYTPPFTRRPTLTPYSSSTPSSTPLPTSTPFPTSLPVPTATIIPAQPPATPAGPPTTYQLKLWTEADAQAAIAEAKGYAPSWTGIYGNWQDSYSYTHLLLEEFLSRFPNTPNWVPMAWELAKLENLEFYGTTRNSYLLPQLLENALNIEKIPLGNFETYLSENYGFNAFLFPNIESGSVLILSSGKISTIEKLSSFFLTKNETGQYQVVRLIETIGTHPELILVSVNDNNGNGLPEVALVEEDSFSGHPASCRAQFWVLEWQPDHNNFVNLAEDVERFNTSYSEGQCNNLWHFEIDINGTSTLIERQQFFTAQRCPPIVYRITYTWNGQQYAWSKPEIEPPSDISQLCVIRWAAEANETSQEAVTILENGLANWPAAMNTLWGPASADYFRLKLGIWQDLRGQSEIASQLIQSVRDQPVAPEYSLASNLAATYLAFRQQYGLTAACNAINNQFYPLFDEIPYDDLGRDMDWVLAEWGFASPNWWFRTDLLCDEYTALQLETRALGVVNDQQVMVNWLNQIGIPWLVVQEADLNNDGLQDWLLLSDTIASYRSWDLWAFVQETTGYNLVWINEVYTDSRPDTILHQATQYNSLNINAVAIEDDLFIFTLFPEVSGRPVKKLLPFSWELEAGTITNLEFLANSPLPALLVSGTENNGQYNWSDESAIFSLADPNLGPEIIPVQQLIFQEGNYAQAITQIQESLAQEVQLPSYLSPTEAAVEKASIQARLGYLLGLCYELLGDNEQAIATYWQVWQQFPNDIHTLIIRRKLVALTP